MTNFSTSFEQALGELILNGSTTAGDGAGMWSTLGVSQSVGVNKDLYLSLHTTDPGEDGLGTEVNTTQYIGYARALLSRVRSSSTTATRLWSYTNSVGAVFANAAAINFAPVGTGSTGATVTHWGIWTASSAGDLVMRGALAHSTVASASGFKIGTVDSAAPTVVRCNAHGLTTADTIVTYRSYNGAISSSPGGSISNGSIVAVTVTDANTFTIAAMTFAGPGGATILFYKTASIVIGTAGKIPNIPTGAMIIRIT